MAKKKRKVARKEPEPVKKTEEEHLLVLLKYTEGAITPHGSSIDEFFTQQAARIRKQIEDLKKNEVPK